MASLTALAGSTGKPARVEHFTHPERTALSEGAFGQSGLEGGAGARITVTMLQYRRGKRF